MGNQSSGKSSFEQHNWRKIQESGNRVILYNDITMKSIQRHEEVLDCDEGEAISMCKWRASVPQNSCIVDLYEYGIKSAGMCTSQPDLYVITQRIHLLQEIGTISKPEAFLILRDVCSGLKVLFKKFGFFNPRPNIIGVNSEGKAKVWTNQNFAVFMPEKDTIPIPTSELGIVNNLINILESKTFTDNHFPIDFPRNLDFTAVVNYVNQVFASLQGFEVDRVYVDRVEFSKKYNELRQRGQQDQLSRTKAMEAQRRYQQIQTLHQNLRQQQLELERKQQLLKMQLQQQEQMQRQQIQMQLQRQQQIQLEKEKQRQREMQMYAMQQLQVPQTIQNSQGKMMRGTTSTIHSDHNYSNAVVHYPTPQYANALNVPQTTIWPPQPSVANFRQSNAAFVGHPIQPNERIVRQLSPKPPIPQTQNQPRVAYQRKNSMEKHRALKKQIEMVDSMILMDDNVSEEQNKRYVESRIIKYQI